jgi:hypothetical protein
VTSVSHVSEAPGRDPDAEYFQAIEEFFVSRRGDPLFLSNADWLLIRSWREAGLPLRVVLRGIADAMDSHEASWSRLRKVGSLRYCGPEVEAAAARWRKALAGGHDETQLASVLRRLAAALAESATLGAQARAVADRLADELVERAETDTAGQALEAWLRAGEAELLGAIAADTPAAEARALEDEVDRDLAAYRERLPPKVLEQVREESIARRRLEEHGLARMSLWAL